MLDLALLYPPLAITAVGFLLLLTGARATGREDMVPARVRTRQKRF